MLIHHQELDGEDYLHPSKYATIVDSPYRWRPAIISIMYHPVLWRRVRQGIKNAKLIKRLLSR